MAELQDQILKEIQSVIPDVNIEKARDLVNYLTSDDVSVRCLDHLYDIGLDDIAQKVPKSDANRLHRQWQQKYRK